MPPMRTLPSVPLPSLPSVPRRAIPRPAIPRPSLASPADMLGRIRRDVERSALRARNLIKYVGGLDRPQVGQSPKDVVWSRDKAELWHYRRVGKPVGYTPPVLIVMSLISRSYVLDLSPDNSFIGQLREAGLDVYLLDWGVPDEADAANKLETYVDEYLPRAIQAVERDSGCPEVNVLGYCYGGILALLLAARHPELPIRAMMTMATPIDFDQMGLFGHLFDHGVKPEDLIDASGNVSPDTIRNGFRVLKPTGDIASYATLWEHLWNDEYMAGYQAMGQWTGPGTTSPSPVRPFCRPPRWCGRTRSRKAPCDSAVGRCRWPASPAPCSTWWRRRTTSSRSRLLNRCPRWWARSRPRSCDCQPAISGW